MSKKAVAFIAGSFLILITFILVLTPGLTKEKTIADQLADSQQNAPSIVEAEAMVEDVKSLSKTDGQGAVIVDITLSDPAIFGNSLVFEVVLNTHSVDLTQYDYASIATISNGNGVMDGSFTWAPLSNDSHHMQGYLKWPAKEGDIFGKDFKELTLELKGIDDIESRVFKWSKNDLSVIGKEVE